MDQKQILKPNHIYEVGKEIPEGRYFFYSNLECPDNNLRASLDEEAKFILYSSVPGVTRQTKGYMGIANVDIRLGTSVKIENGCAIFYGTEEFNLHKILLDADISDGTFLKSGIIAYSNSMIEIRIFYKSKKPKRFHGSTDVLIYEQYIYSVNNHTFFAIFAEHKTYKKSCEVSRIGVEFIDSHAQANFERRHGAIYSSEFNDSIRKSYFTYRKPYQDTTINQSGHLLIVEFPVNIPVQPVNLKWVELEGHSQQHKCTGMSMRETYLPHFLRLEEILKKYVDISIPLDIEKELNKFNEAPDFLTVCSDFLEKQYNILQQYASQKIDEHTHFTFRVKISYDKRFYSSAKLADQAIDIQISPDKTMYLVTFSGKQIEEMCLMYENTSRNFEPDSECLKEIYKYLYDHDYFTYLSRALYSKIAELRDNYGFYSFVGNSVLYSLAHAIHSIRMNKLTEYYNEMVSENRVRTKWGSEYKLYTLTKEYCSDALYQHRPVWLGQQSFDIFIPSQNIAIEYQGLQHYQAVDHFGGQASLAYNQERDARKRKLSAEHGVRVLEWKYDSKVTSENVQAFFDAHGVVYTVPVFPTIGDCSGLRALEIAPVLLKPEKKKDKKSKKSESPFVIRQYSPEGKFLREYPSVADATAPSGVSAKAINNSIYNVRPLGGGYVWRRCRRDSAIEDITPVQRKKNTGVARKICQYSVDGDFIAEYKSMGEAARQVGISSRSISDALSGVQKTAGNYIWVYSKQTEEFEEH